MIRPGLLAVLAVVIAPVASPAQMGGMMGGMGGMMGGMGGMMGGQRSIEQDRAVKIELIGGQSVSGRIRLGPVVVDGEVGRYAINPDKVRTIRLSKPVEQPAGDGTIPYNSFQGTVITTSGKEIRGGVHIPDWRLEIDDGTLKLVPARLKTLSFMAEPEKQRPERTSAKTPATKYMRLENTIILTSPRGGRLTFLDLRTKKTTSVRLSESDETAPKVVPIWGPNAVALSLRGPKITRIAAANGLNGTWHTQDLREPVKGEAMPLVGSGVVVYGLGRYIYAYSVAAQRWDVAELPKGAHAVPIVGPNSVTAEIPGHIYTFNAEIAQWNHVDIDALLETASDKDTDAPKN